MALIHSVSIWCAPGRYKKYTAGALRLHGTDTNTSSRISLQVNTHCSADIFPVSWRGRAGLDTTHSRSRPSPLASPPSGPSSSPRKACQGQLAHSGAGVALFQDSTLRAFCFCFYVNTLCLVSPQFYFPLLPKQ